MNSKLSETQGIFNTFKDIQLEDKYRAWVLENTKSLTIRTGVIATMVFVLFFVVDSIIIGSFYWPSFFVRILFTIPFLSIGISQLNKIKSSDSFDNIISFLEIASHSAVLFLCYLASFPMYYIAILVTVFMFMTSMTIGVSLKRQVPNLFIIALLSMLYFNFLHPNDTSVFEKMIFNSIIIIDLIITIFANSIFCQQNRDLFVKFLDQENQQEIMQAKNNQIVHINKMLAHDLKTPIRNISSFVTLLERQMSTLKDEESELFDYIKINSRKISNMVQDYLEFSKLEEGFFQDQQLINLNGEIEEIITSFKDENPQENLEITIESILPTILINKNNLISLVQNLLTNAIKYNANKKKSIKISSHRSGYYDVIHIKDNGIGIPKKYHQKVFNIFERLNPDYYQEGTGIGLAHCKAILNKLGGKLELKSTPSMGSTFSLFFPIERKKINSGLENQN